MKKIGRILFTVMFVTVGLFGMSNASAADYQIRFDNNYFEYYLENNNNKLKMEIMEDQPELIVNAINHFYSNGLTSDIVDVVPFKFTVQGDQPWDTESDSATMYIRIPKLFNVSADNGQSIYLVRIQKINGKIETYAHDIGTTYKRNYEIKDYNDVKSQFISGSIVSENPSEDYFTDKVAVLKTSEFETTGTTYYMLITCKGQITIPSTNPTNPTNPTQPANPTQPTNPTTVDNPKTADASTQLYIIIGTICLVGIIGLGAKFAKSNK